MSTTHQLIDHLRNLAAISGSVPPTLDQWREIQDKVKACMHAEITGQLAGSGNMDPVSDSGVANVAISC